MPASEMPKEIIEYPAELLEFTMEKDHWGSARDLVAQLKTKRSNVETAITNLESLKNHVALEKKLPDTTIENDIVVWHKIPDVKTNIEKDPTTAIKAFLQFPTLWTLQEATEIAYNDPLISYHFAKKFPKADIKQLQRGAGRDPRIAYHFAKHIPGASVKFALEQTEHNPYYYYLIRANLKKEGNEALYELKSRRWHDPEAAYGWFVIHGATNDQLALGVLQRSPRYAYMTGLSLYNRYRKQLGQSSVAWNRLREAALSDPQWAFHWTRDIEPENLMKNSEAICVDPVWWVAALSAMGPKKPEERTKAFNRIKELYPEFLEMRGPYYEPVNQWALLYTDDPEFD